MKRFTLFAAAAVLAVAATACGDEGGSGGGGGGDAGTTVSVTLQEYSVIPAQDSASAGSITFQVENTGPDDIHEFVVIATDLAPDALPTDENGVVLEEGEGMEVIDEIEDIPVGETPSLTVDLEAGSYVLICNIFEEDEGEAHYTEGMRTSFTVE